MSDTAVIGRINESWKVYLAFWCFRVGILMTAIGAFLFSLWHVNMISVVFGAAFLLPGLHLLPGAVIFALTAIRCPGCRARALLDLEYKSRLPYEIRRDLSHDPFGLILWQGFIAWCYIVFLAIRLRRPSNCPLCGDEQPENPPIYNTWAVRQTGQLWKIYVASLGFLAGVWTAIILVLRLSKSFPFSIYEGILFLVAFHLLIGSCIFLLLTVRCPVCRVRWFGGNSKYRDPEDLITYPIHLLTFSECPRCSKEKNSDKRVLDRILTRVEEAGKT